MSAAREALYTRLREVLGDPDAETLMEILPPTSDIATRADIRDLGTDIDVVKTSIVSLEGRVGRLEDRTDRLETLMERFDERLHGFHVELRQQTRTFALATTSSAALVAMVVIASASMT